MEGNKKHKCMYCDYASDRAHDVKMHSKRKHPENHPFLKNVTILKTYKCKLCNYTSDQSNNVSMHVMEKHVEEQHETKPSQKVVMEKMEYPSTVDEAALENKLEKGSNEFIRKLELGREIKEIMIRRKWMKASLSAEDREALEIFEKHGQDKDVKPVEWRPWQKGLLKYVNNPTHRRIIWVVGGEGNEGKTFFQGEVEKEYGKHRVCIMNITERTENLFAHMRRNWNPPHLIEKNIVEDIFLFNIPKGGGRTGEINYRLMEKIKRGVVKVKIAGCVKRVRFTTPNVIIVFSHEYPDTKMFSRDKWLIFKINAGMELEDVTEARLGVGMDEV